MMSPWPIYDLTIITLSSKPLIALREALRARRGVQHLADAGNEEATRDG